MADPQELLFHAKVASWAYLDPKQSKPKYKELGLKVVKYYDVDGAQAYLLSRKDRTVLAFRGTEPSEASDIFADLNALRDPEPIGGRVHQGFQGELDKLWMDIIQDVNNGITNNKLHQYLTVCGHSLGGAMATLAAGRLHKSETKPIALYTFGSPRVGNRRWLKQVKDLTHYRCVNNNDVVPKVPPAFMLYKHHGDLTYFNCFGFIRELTGWQRMKDQWRGRKRAWQKGQAFDGVYDHAMTGYIKSINHNLTEE